VVTNYLTNALKYSPGDQPVEVWLEVGETEARICVHDEGPGLPEAEQARIWERFQQVEGIKPQSGTDGGLGLGLYISRTIVEQYRGEVGLESAPGQGATFWCMLPLASANEEVG
jgi:signal transduction histidine kinase